MNEKKKSVATVSTDNPANSYEEKNYNIAKTHSIAIGTDPINFDNEIDNSINTKYNIKPQMKIRNNSNYTKNMDIKKPLSGRENIQLPFKKAPFDNIARKQTLSAKNNNNSNASMQTNEQLIVASKEQQQIDNNINKNLVIKPTSSEKSLKISSLGKFEKRESSAKSNMDLLSERIKARMDTDEREIEKFLNDLN